MKVSAGFWRMAVGVLFCLAACETKPAEKAGTGEGHLNKKVEQFFANAMGEGFLKSQAGFPDLGWNDIPALMEHVDSTVKLQTILVNPLSSQLPEDCTEGMMAMWLIEGIRVHPVPDFASLIPDWGGPEIAESDEVLKRRVKALHDAHTQQEFLAINQQAWLDRHVLVQAVVAKAYHKWWREAGSVSESLERSKDPLAGTGYGWR